jgi:hypothetical protein
VTRTYWSKQPFRLQEQRFFLCCLSYSVNLASVYALLLY